MSQGDRVLRILLRDAGSPLKPGENVLAGPVQRVMIWKLDNLITHELPPHIEAGRQSYNGGSDKMFWSVGASSVELDRIDDREMAATLMLVEIFERDLEQVRLMALGPTAFLGAFPRGR
jgi:hypothetical protein